MRIAELGSALSVRKTPTKSDDLRHLYVARALYRNSRSERDVRFRVTTAKVVSQAIRIFPRGPGSLQYYNNIIVA